MFFHHLHQEQSPQIFHFDDYKSQVQQLCPQVLNCYIIHFVFENNQNPLELFEIYGAKGLEEFARVNPKLLRDPRVNQYLEEARARDYILTPAIPGRPTELVPYSAELHKQLLSAGPSAYSFLYQLLYIDNIFTVGDKIAVYSGDLESPNIIHAYDLTTTMSK